LSFFVTLFNFRKSTQNLHLPFFFLTNVTGDTQGLDEGLIRLFFKHLSISFLMISSSIGDVLYTLCLIGGIFSVIISCLYTCVRPSSPSFAITSWYLISSFCNCFLLLSSIFPITVCFPSTIGKIISPSSI